ncbi:MAG: glutamate--tRNA ligase, partial [Bdellovibrionota bacterium]
MTVRVRFAPSPTGYLHIGGARTCLYNFLFARSHAGTLVLRVEDTDLDRSSRQFEQAQRADLQWLGITFDEGPEIGGHFGPYRQSERHKIYEEVAAQLMANGHAFYCFCREEVLERKKAAALAQNLNPAYDGTCYGVTPEEAQDRLAKGEEGVVRFKVPNKSYTLNDLVRGEVVFPAGMVGDFVLLRSNKMPTYNFCCVVDDIKMKFTHVIRGEDHLNNTLRQLMIYEALGATPPQFAHASLLIGKDRQKLSKRHGATSVAQYREEGYLPEALLNYLCLLGWSHPAEKDVFTMTEIIPLFGIERFSKASPIYDLDKLAYINNQHLRLLSVEELASRYAAFTKSHTMFLESTVDWQHRFLNLFKEKAQTF